MEIERKFHLSKIPDCYQELAAEPISQGYLALGDDEIRIRKQADQYYLTYKSGSGLIRNELEISIDKHQFEILWPASEGRRLEKMRRAISWGNHRIEIDQYLGKLAPLIVAEVEFSSIEDSQNFEPPSFFGHEITGVADFSNAVLCQKGLLA